MTINSSLTTLFQVEAEHSNGTIIALEDINHKPVGALYLNDIKYKRLTVSETNNTERYYLYIDGVGIFFSFFKFQR